MIAVPVARHAVHGHLPDCAAVRAAADVEHGKRMGFSLDLAFQRFARRRYRIAFAVELLARELLRLIHAEQLRLFLLFPEQSRLLGALERLRLRIDGRGRFPGTAGEACRKHCGGNRPSFHGLRSPLSQNLPEGRKNGCADAAVSAFGR